MEEDRLPRIAPPPLAIEATSFKALQRGEQPSEELRQPDLQDEDLQQKTHDAHLRNEAWILITNYAFNISLTRERISIMKNIDWTS